MPYGNDMAGAARRHLKAAQNLYDEPQPGAKPGCRAVSGYLFGLAGELAIKQLMLKSGMKPKPEDRRNDPFYAHFPQLRTMVADSAYGRLQGPLRALTTPNVFENWSTDMRYAPTTDVQEQWVERWKTQATKIVEQMGEL